MDKWFAFNAMDSTSSATNAATANVTSVKSTLPLSTIRDNAISALPLGRPWTCNGLTVSAPTFSTFKIISAAKLATICFQDVKSVNLQKFYWIMS